MPPPVSANGVEQRQAVNGEVAIEVVMRVEDQRHPDQGGPDETESQHHPRPAKTSNECVGGGIGLVTHQGTGSDGLGSNRPGHFFKLHDGAILFFHQVLTAEPDADMIPGKDFLDGPIPMAVGRDVDA